MSTAYKDYYATLGVPKTAAPKEIKAAFRKLARKHHPDLNPNDPAATARFKEVNEANEVLSDPEKRTRYDQLGPQWNGMGGGGRQVEYQTMSAADLEQIFGNAAPFSDFFYSAFGGGPMSSGPSR
ncbi:MAG: DnaJ domain-containing protein, partial [Candidatus Dormibacteraeota bacterium]|nr:DnaJ domain-containing protein [Candidatus Dormibacteraeota bacterium]